MPQTHISNATAFTKFIKNGYKVGRDGILRLFPVPDLIKDAFRCFLLNFF
jgi:hypothetical protein